MLLDGPHRQLGGTTKNMLLGSGPVGDDDLWYHHIPGMLRYYFFFFFHSPAGSEALPTGSEAFPAGLGALPAGTEALPVIFDRLTLPKPLPK